MGQYYLREKHERGCFCEDCLFQFMLCGILILFVIGVPIVAAILTIWDN